MQEADEAVKRYLQHEFTILLSGNYIAEWIAVHLDYSDRQRGDLTNLLATKLIN